MKSGVLFLLAASALAAAAAAPQAEHPAQEIEAVRKFRVAELQKPDGWLTLVGLHFLPAGESTIGRAKDNTVALAAGPARLGRVTLAADGAVTLAMAAGVDAQVEGKPVRVAQLKPGEGKVKPTMVTVGTVSLFAIERGGKKALRVKDSASPRRTQFAGLDYFATDPGWRIEARWVAFEKSRMVPITNALGQTAPEPVPGKAVFERGGRTYELLPIDEGRDVPLFFVISDATSGKESYGAGRFLYVPWPTEGAKTIVLDFNLAENPPCAFTPFATCPLPPKENRLPFAVAAGEKNYRGGHK